MSDRDDIWRAITEVNAAWLRGEPRAIAPLFHDQVIMAGPDGTPRFDGVHGMVESFVAYCGYAKTHAFDVIDHQVHLFGDTSIVTYRYRVRYEVLDSDSDDTSAALGAGIHDEEGGELLVLVRRDAGWQAVWRMQLALD